MKGEDKIRLAFDNAAPADGDGEGGNSRELRLARKSRNDSGNGERYRDRHGRNLMYVPHVGRFFYTGSYWSVEVGDQQWALAAAKTAQNILDETAALKAETIPLPGSVGVVDLKAHENGCTVSRVGLLKAAIEGAWRRCRRSASRF